MKLKPNKNIRTLERQKQQQYNRVQQDLLLVEMENGFERTMDTER